MVIDTSALIAILSDEPERRRFIEAIEAADRRSISLANFVEAAIVIEARFGADGFHDLERFVLKAEIELVPVEREHAFIALDAYRRFGKGRHPAGLNYGDCFSYALAAAVDEPLLFKGADFAATDVVAAVGPASG